MAKQDAVESLMEQAHAPARKTATAPQESADGTEERAATSVLEEQISAAEPVAPGPEQIAERPTGGLPAIPPPSPVERGRQLFGALRPLLPAVGKALGMVDHGAAQAAARLLPLLGTATGLGESRARSDADGPVMAAVKQIEKRQTTLEQQSGDHTSTLLQHDDQIRRMRDTIARMSSEDNLMENRVTRLADRTRMLVVFVIILLLLVAAEGAMLFLRH